MGKVKHAYDASHIKVLEGIEAVRRRPAMYIGDTATRGLHHLVYEVVDNSIDEALVDESMGGTCKSIDVRINADESASVADDGRGMPVGMHPTEKRPTLEIILTKLHSGGKFDHRSYKVSGGLHGVGVSVVNALSEWLEVVVQRDGGIYHQEYARGKVKTALKKLGKSNKTGTKVVFKPDPKIFPDCTFNMEILSKRMRELAFLTKGVTIRLTDERSGKEEVFCYRGGIREFVTYLNAGRGQIHKDVIYFERQSDNVQVEGALQYTDKYTENTYSFANSINTTEGGTHVTGFKSALTRVMNQYAKSSGLLKNEEPPGGDDWREGLTAIISVRVPEPQFEGQTKTKLGNSEVGGIVEQVTYEALSTYVQENPKQARAIIGKALLASRARRAAKCARDLARRKGALSSGSLPGKLADCSSTDVVYTEVYIVEGDSAGGSAKQARDRRYQAILPLRGKILNVEKARIDKMLNHEEIRTLISALGTGIGADDFDIAKLRYGKVIIMTDADVDGSHIRTLLLTFFFRHTVSLIEQGHLYIAQPPLYRLRRKSKEEYIFSEEAKERVLLDLGLDGTSLLAGPKKGKKETWSNAKLRGLIDMLTKMEAHAAVMRKRGLPFRQYLSRALKNNRLPKFRLRLNGTYELFHEAEELEEFLEAQRRKTGEEMISSEEDIMELHEAAEIEATIALLGTKGFSLQDYYATSDLVKLALLSEGAEQIIPSLDALLPAIRKLGQKGLDVQRYKGLGEMNPDQLWATTMDPKTRTLSRVTLDDVVYADLMFSTLMGSGVEPRRAFIERYALEVRNLDV